MSYYKHHVFFCLNERPEGERQSCNRCGASDMHSYMKDKIKSLKLAGPGGVRINKAGCLDRCEQGPVMVIYPEETWYTYLDESDIDEVIEQHIVDGRIVERLKI